MATDLAHYVPGLRGWLGLVVLVLLAVGVGVSLVVRSVRQRSGWLVTTRVGSRLRRCFPAQLDWLGQRLDPKSRSGLGLTVAVLVAVASAWLFADVTQDVLAREEFVRVDPVVQAAVVPHRIGWVTAGMQVVTWLGSSVVLVPVMLVATVFVTCTKRDVRGAAGLWAAYLGAVALYDLVKVLVGRPRPAVADDLVHASGAAFPSGHAAQALAVWGMLTALLIRGRSRRIRAAAVTGSTLLVLLIGASRVYLGAHWLTDVAGGFALGGMWLALVLALGMEGQRRPVGGQDRRHQADQVRAAEHDAGGAPRDRQRGHAIGDQNLLPGNTTDKSEAE